MSDKLYQLREHSGPGIQFQDVSEVLQTENNNKRNHFRPNIYKAKDVYGTHGKISHEC